MGGSPLPDRMFDIDCRTTAGARFGEAPRPAYIDTNEFFDVLSCRPTYTFGNSGGSWHVRTLSVWEPMAQLQGDDANLVRRDQNLDAMCRDDGTPNDVVCTRAKLNRASCRREGRYSRCALTPHDRDVLLNRVPK
jgi:hypothetical protein